MPAKIRVLILDLDNTLIDSDRAYAHALAQIGLSPTDPRYNASRETVKRRLGEGNVNARNRLAYFKAMLESDRGYGPEALLSLMDRYEKALAEHIASDWQNRGRPALLARLARRYPMAMLTNENLRTQLVKLRAIDPRGELFPVVVTSEEIGFEKPDRRMFEAALARLGAEPGECLMVGDSVTDDIEPALALGMRAIHISEFGTEQAACPAGVPTLASLNELERALERELTQ